MNTLPGFNTATHTYSTAGEAISAALSTDKSLCITKTYEPNLYGLLYELGNDTCRAIYSIHVVGGRYTYDSIP